MYNQAFHSISLEEKKEKLQKALSFKAPFLASKDIQTIICSIPLHNQYEIKVIYNREKFRNIITNERVITDQKEYYGQTYPIIGNCFPGLYEKKGGQVKTVQTIISASASLFVAMKEVKEKRGECCQFYYTLVIYYSKWKR